MSLKHSAVFAAALGAAVFGCRNDRDRNDRGIPTAPKVTEPTTPPATTTTPGATTTTPGTAGTTGTSDTDRYRSDTTGTSGKTDTKTDTMSGQGTTGTQGTQGTQDTQGTTGTTGSTDTTGQLDQNQQNQQQQQDQMNQQNDQPSLQRGDAGVTRGRDVQGMNEPNANPESNTNTNDQTVPSNPGGAADTSDR